MIRLLRDYETRCDVSVVDVGTWKYACHPSNEILCVGWRIKEDAAWAAPRVAVVQGGSDGRRAIERRVEESGFHAAALDDYRRDCARAQIFVAHNVGFEVAHECRHFPELKSLERWQSCTAARGRRLSLPGSLEDMCRVLRTPHQKDMRGHSGMLQVSQPRPAWNRDPRQPKWFEDAERLAKCAVYCLKDILAECDLDDFLPELPESERAYWLQTESRNMRGIRLDMPLIEGMSRVVQESSRVQLDEVRRVTGVPDFELTNVQLIQHFLVDRGVRLPDLRAATVEDALAAHRSGRRRIDAAAVTVMEARQQSGGKSSVAKLAAMRERVMHDGRARDLTIYHGAHTGRPTGSGINVLNLPRPFSGYRQEPVIAAIRTGDRRLIETTGSNLATAAARKNRPTAPPLHVSASACVSASLRGTIIPSEGKKLVIGDYTSIEPCAEFTLARQWDVVEMLRQKKSLYIEFGKDMYGRTLDKERDLVEYTVCKATILGCGYGLGEDNFVAKLQREGVDAPEDVLRRAHRAYRERYLKIKELWGGVGEAAKSTIRNPGTTFVYNDLAYVFDGWWLACVLPNGRPLSYPNARLVDGRFGQEIVYEGWRTVDGRPAGWGDVRTYGARLVENACQAICRDVTDEDELEIQALPGWDVLLTVYDEVVAECPAEETGARDRMLAIMSRSTTWLPQMPVSASGFEATMYRKD